MRGVDASFSAFVRERSLSLYRFACLITGDRHLAEDLLQHVLLNVYRRWGSIREPSAAEAYARTALVRSVISWRRRRSWRGEILVAETPEDRFLDGTTAVDDRHSLLPFLRSLPARQRAVLVLRYYEDMSEEQIAETLGCSRGAVKSHSARALAKLRSGMRANDHGRQP